jgi:AraC-like DNA-binding protein/mannose-6-phosphate isomerase-like protein (cupin superfamily)
MNQQNQKNLKNNLSKRIINTPDSAAKHTFFYMQETGRLTVEDAAATQRQNLDSFLFVAVVSGKGELTVDGETFSVTGGECFFIDCRISHTYKSSKTNPWDLLWVHFNGSTSEQYYEYFLSMSKHVFRPAAFERIVSVITEIIDINEFNSPNADIFTSRLIVELLTIALTSETSSQENDSALRQKIASVHNYIEQNFSSNITLEQLSAKFYISKYYLTREYKKIYGKTIFQHIISLRISYGKQLLRFSDKSVEEIAALCGFNDQSYFARQFKKTENLTCFAYRKMWRD